MNILVYNGPGTSVGSVKHTIKSLKSLVSCHYDIIPIDHIVLNQPLATWMDTTSLIVIPGGRDLPYVQYLSPYGVKHIKAFVQKGGSYLGLCAGSYFACQEIDFSLNRHVLYDDLYDDDDAKEKDDKIQGKRELSFYPGIAYGAISPHFTYNSEKGSRAVNLVLDNIPSIKSLKVYINGAPYFDLNGIQDPHSKVIGWYDLKSNKAAIVECSVGNGKAILSGPHLEFDPKETSLTLNQMNQETRACMEKILPHLLQDNPYRLSLLRSILERLGLKLNQENTDLDSIPTSPIFMFSLFNNFTSDLMLLADKSTAFVDTMDEWRLSIDSEGQTYDPTKLNLILVNENSSKRNYKFDIQEYFKQLLKCFPHSFGSIIMYGDTVTSTQSILEKNYQLSLCIPHGTVFVASQQVSGRGRGRNSWISQEGCLMFSLVIEHGQIKSLVFIQYLFALAVVHSIRCIPELKDFPIHIKWPNDIYVKSLENKLVKVGGILVTSSFEKGVFKLVIGCGLNVLNAAPTVSLAQIADQYHLPRDKLTREYILAVILSQFERMYHSFLQEGSFSDFLPLYHAMWLHSNQNVVVAHEVKGNVKAVIIGLDPTTGYLQAQLDSTREIILLQPDGNSFDMMKGLISKKEI